MKVTQVQVAYSKRLSDSRHGYEQANASLTVELLPGEDATHALRELTSRARRSVALILADSPIIAIRDRAAEELPKPAPRTDDGDAALIPDPDAGPAEPSR